MGIWTPQKALGGKTEKRVNLSGVNWGAIFHIIPLFTLIPAHLVIYSWKIAILKGLMSGVRGLFSSGLNCSGEVLRLLTKKLETAYNFVV